MDTVLGYLQNSAEKYKNKIAVICEEDSITYEDLNKYSKIVGSFYSEKNYFNKPISIFMDKIKQLQDILQKSIYS